MRRVLRVFSALLVIALALGVLAWLLGRFFTDQWEWSQFLWWIPTPITLAAAVLAVLVLLGRWLFLDRSGAAVLVGLTIVLVLGAYFAFVEHRLFSGSPENPDGVLIMSWNWTHSVPHHVDLHVDQFLKYQPDIAFMADGQRLRRSEKELARIRPDWQVEGVSMFTVVSRWPILSMRPLVTNDTTHVALVEIDTTLRLGRPTVYMLCDMPSELDIPRMEHMRQVHSMIVSSGAPFPDVAVGDFNVPRGSASFKALFPNMHNAFDDAGHGYSATYYRPFPLYHIDNTLVGESVNATDYFIVDPGFGRHRIQLVRIVLTPSPP